jgi:hypothetical protein
LGVEKFRRAGGKGRRLPSDSVLSPNGKSLLY